MIKFLVGTALLIGVAANAATLRTGTIHCEDSNYRTVKLSVKQHPSKPHKIIVNWLGKDRILHAEKSVSGAIRYDGAVSKLTYLQMPSHSVLLDSNAMRPILTECR